MMMTDAKRELCDEHRGCMYDEEIDDYEERQREPETKLGICAECFHFTKKGSERKCECKDSDHYNEPVHSIQENCDCFDAYWW